jgi:hypothetical protein
MPVIATRDAGVPWALAGDATQVREMSTCSRRSARAYRRLANPHPTRSPIRSRPPEASPAHPGENA